MIPEDRLIIASVVLPARDCELTLGPAVDSALVQDGVAEVVIAVGPSSDGTLDQAHGCAARDSRVAVVANPAGTTPAALNVGLAATSAPFIVRLDAHAVLPDGYVARVLGHLQRDAQIGNVGGRQVPVSSTGFGRAVATAMVSPLGTGGASYRQGVEAGPVDTVYLGSFRRSALEGVGNYDERMLRNQDYELNIRLRRAGWIVWLDPDLAVEYQPRSTTRSLARQYFDYGRYRRLTARLHPGTLRLRQLAPPALVLVLLVAAVLSVGARSLLPSVMVTAGYLGALIVGGIAADPRRALGIAWALAVMHVSWGIGFLVGPPRPIMDRE